MLGFRRVLIVLDPGRHRGWDFFMSSEALDVLIWKYGNIFLIWSLNSYAIYSLIPY